MDYTHSVINWFKSDHNLEYVGDYTLPSGLPCVYDVAVANHKQTLEYFFRKYLYEDEIRLITQEYRRSEVDNESILTDFFSGNVEPFEIPFDEHVEYGLQCMADAFRPTRLCRPVHILDVKQGYPYKWDVSAEAPFSTDEYFLKKRMTFGEFVSMHANEHDDFFRRHANVESHDLLVPAKFGYLKSMIFSWTRRWHHVVKSGFKDLAQLGSTGYDDPNNRFIFPMLLDTEPAIVKYDDPNPNKMRSIWGVSKPWIIAETMLYWEYIAWLKLNPGISPMLWGYEILTGGMLRLNSELWCGLVKRSFLTLHWSRFDKQAYFPLLLRIMQKARTFLTFEDGYVPTHAAPNHPEWSPDHTLGLERLWNWTLENLFEAPVILPDGRMFKRHYAGIPSGLFITQLLDSWYNYTMLATLLSALGFDPRQCITKVQGEDSIIRLNTLIPEELHASFMSRLVELAVYYFNATVNIKKSEIGNTLNGREVLSYRNRHGMPWRDAITMLAQFYHTKARNPTPEITMAQAVAFAYASCGNDERVLKVLQEIYCYYQAHGFTPNPAGLTLIFGESHDNMPMSEIPLDHFPTYSETKNLHFCNDYVNHAQKARTWPRTLFINAPAE